MMLAAAMGLERARLISVCGAGGKTTLIFALAGEFVSAGEKVLVTTTTKMAAAEVRGRLPALEADSADDVLRLAAKDHDHAGAIFAGAGANGAKLTGYEPEIVDAIAGAGWFDSILVEADGSRRRPLKAPAGHEPVFPGSSDAVIMVAGLNGVGQMLHEDNVFRAGVWARLTGLKIGDRITPDCLAVMISSSAGLARGCPAQAGKTAFLNRADRPRNLDAARKVRQALADSGDDGAVRLVAGRLLPDPAVVELPGPNAV